MVRLALPILALALGAALAVGLVSCGGGDDEGLLPGDNAQQIVDNLNQVELDAENGDCDSAAAAADEVQAQIEELGNDVNAELKQRLADGAAQLEQVISDSCVDTATIPTVETTTEEHHHRRANHREGKDRLHNHRNDDHDDSNHDTHDSHDPDDRRYAGRRRRGSARSVRERTGKRLMAQTLLSDRYELQDRLGSGGMSNVYRATDRILERTVAVKILAEHLSDDERFVARFRREALAVAKLIHPNIVQVYDTGIDQDRHFIVMEYVEGRSGAQILQRDRHLDPVVTVEIGVQSCAGLDYAHRHGIIHRDVKPGNLMIVGDPDGDGRDMSVKLTDFGIARAAEQTRITQVGSVVGTAAYLAPEQVRGEEATPASDVYALGVVLYQFLTGRLPYEGASLAELAVRQQNERPLAPRTYNDEVPETLSGAVLRALEGEPERRYVSAKQLAEGLRLGLAGTDVTLALGRRAGDAPAGAGACDAPPGARPSGAPLPRRRPHGLRERRSRRKRRGGARRHSGACCAGSGP